MILTRVSTSQAREGSIHYRMKRYAPSLQIHKSMRTEQLQLAVLPVSGRGYPNKLISGCAPLKFPRRSISENFVPHNLVIFGSAV